MVQEIDLAADAGIAYFAFLAYEDSDPLSQGLRTYLRAPNRNRLRFALISEMNRWGNRDLYRAVIERYVRLMREPQYQLTPDGRPLFYLGFVSEEEIAKRFGSRKDLRARIDEFRSLARQSGLKNPYIVLMDSQVPRAGGFFRDLGADAVSAYALFDSKHHGKYGELVDLVEQFWRDVRNSDIPLVPPIMTGWDRRPRVLNPLTWEDASTYSEEQMLRFYERPTMPELERHITSALRLAASAGGSPARTAIAYAWNEFDEGGWIAPTRGEGSRRLNAVKAAIEFACPS